MKTRVLLITKEMFNWIKSDEVEESVVGLRWNEIRRWPLPGRLEPGVSHIPLTDRQLGDLRLRIRVNIKGQRPES